MNLDYKILWFEDRDEWYDEAKKTIGNIVDEHGFNFPEPVRYKNSVDWDSHNLRDFDLILVDFKLDNETGDSIIEKIRANDVYTEIIFYSTDGDVEIRKTIAEKGIDGVFCASRDGGAFERKVNKVIEVTLKKVQDINNMRGLIMSATSDLDDKMNDIIALVFSKHPAELQKSLAEKIFGEVGNSVKEKGEKFDKWSKNLNITKLMGDTLMFDAAKKIAAIQHILDNVHKEAFVQHRENKFSNGYKADVSENRNIFGHVTLKEEDGKKKLFSRTKEIEFTDEFCVDVRGKLKKYTMLLNEIYTLLSE